MSLVITVETPDSDLRRLRLAEGLGLAVDDLADSAILEERVREVLTGDVWTDPWATPGMAELTDLVVDALSLDLFAAAGLSPAAMAALDCLHLKYDIEDERGGRYYLCVDGARTFMLAPLGAGYVWRSQNYTYAHQQRQLIEGSCLMLPEGTSLPETVTTAYIGRPMHDLVRHPILEAHGLTIKEFGVMAHAGTEETTQTVIATRETVPISAWTRRSPPNGEAA